MQKSCPTPSAWEILTLYSLRQERLKTKLAETGSAGVERMPTCRRPWVWPLPTKRNWAKQTNNKTPGAEVSKPSVRIWTVCDPGPHCWWGCNTVQQDSEHHMFSPQSKSISEYQQVLFTYPNEWSVWCHSKRHKRTFGIRTPLPAWCTQDG